MPTIDPTPPVTYYGEKVGTEARLPVQSPNVDLANEFTALITTQRGYQANARVITTSDEILQELVNLKR